MKRYLALLGGIITVIVTGGTLWFALPYLPAVALFLVAMFVVSVLLLVTWLALHVVSHSTRVLHATDQAIYVQRLGRVQIYQHIPYQVAPHQTVVTQVPQQLALPSPSMLPSAPTFQSIRHLIQPGRLILGYSSGGAIYGDVSDLLSMGIVGKPGTGKSSALLYYLAMLLLVQADVYVFDPHGSLNELAVCLNYADDLSEIAGLVPQLHRELDERCTLYKRTRQVRKPLLILIDELPVISRFEQKSKPQGSTLELVERVVLEGRKWNCYVILSGQSLPADVLPTLTRDNLSSRIVFNSSTMHARMIGLDEDSRKKLLPMLKRAQPGTAILDVSRRSEPDVVSLPYTTVDDLHGIVEGAFNELHTGFQGLSELSREAPPNGIHKVITGNLLNTMKDDEKGGESKPEFSREEAEEILRIAHTQIATYGKVIRSKIPGAMLPPRNNAIYPVVKAVLDEKGL